MENNEVQQVENSVLLPKKTSETLKTIGIILVIAAFALFVTQNWSDPSNLHVYGQYDFPFHYYRMEFVADHLQHLNFNFDFDYKSNTLAFRAYPWLAYLVGAPFIILFGLDAGISTFVVFCFLLLGIGMYFFGRTLSLSKEASLFLSIAILFSYTLVLETQWAGALHRLLAYVFLPFILVCYFRRAESKFVVLIGLLIAATLFIHPFMGILFIFLLCILFVIDLFKNNVPAKSFLPLIAAIFLGGLITIPYFGVIVIENNSLCAGFTMQGIEALGNSIGVSSLLERSFGPIGQLETANLQVANYLGWTIIILALIGLFNREFKKIYWLLPIGLFLILLTFSKIAPPFIRFEHFSTGSFLISFCLSIIAAQGVDLIKKKCSSLNKRIFNLSALLIILLITTLVALDLSPGVTSFPQTFSKEQLTSVSNYMAEHTPEDGRIFYTKQYTGYLFSELTPRDFIQFADPLLNQEYASFTKTIQSKQNISSKTLFLLNVKRLFYIDSNSNLKYDILSSFRVFTFHKAIRINYSTVIESEKVFESILQYNFSLNKVMFILSQGDNTENIDFVLVPNKTGAPKEINLNDLPHIFNNSIAAGKPLPWGKNDDNLEVVVDSPGWVFVSQMWYPHFRVNGKPLYEAGGGLSAFYAETPGIYKIYWERPWYDYLFWTISIVMLILLIYLYFNPRRLDKFGTNE